MSTFLFDILGDAVGYLGALWIIFVTSGYPILIWMGEYLYEQYDLQRVQHEQH